MHFIVKYRQLLKMLNVNYIYKYINIFMFFHP